MYSLFQPDALSLKKGYLVNYGLRDQGNLSFDVSLDMDEGEHFDVIARNKTVIQSQFLIPAQSTMDADDLLELLDQFLTMNATTRIFPENHMSIFIFMLQLSRFSVKRRQFFYDKYFEKIVSYNVLPIFYEKGYKMTKEKFLSQYVPDIVNGAYLESRLRENLSDFSTKG